MSNSSQVQTAGVFPIPVQRNILLSLSLLAISGFLFFLLPLLVPIHTYWKWAALPLILITPLFWATIHESFHSVLHPSKKTNDLLGRLLCIAFGAPFYLLRFGHLSHHRLSRTSYDCPDVYDPNAKSWLRAALIYYPRLLFGLYGTELAANLLLLLPKPWVKWLVSQIFSAAPDVAPNMDKWRKTALLAPARLTAMRLDALATLSLFALSFWLYGEHWPVLLAVLLGRGLLVSLLDNAPHYATPLNDRAFAYNLMLPKSLSLFILNFNYHRVHHHHPQVPWSSLPQIFEQYDGDWSGAYLTLVLQQLRGPLPIAQVQLPSTRA